MIIQAGFAKSNVILELTSSRMDVEPWVGFNWFM